MEMFNFIITENLRSHGKNKLNLGVEVKVHNVQTFKKELVAAKELFLSQEDKAVNSCNFLIKSAAYRQVEYVVSETEELLRLLKQIYIKSEPAFYDDRKEFTENFTEVINYLQEGQHSCKLEKIGVLFISFSEWLKDALSKKIDMCEKLSQLSNRPLKAILTFNERDYETQFTKYHLNLEHFSDILSKMLKEEFNIQYMKNYLILEDTILDLIKKTKEDENQKLEEFLEFADKIIHVQSKIDKFKRPFLVAQVNYEKITQSVDSIVDRIYEVSNKFDDLYNFFSTQNDKDRLYLFARIMEILYQVPLLSFLERKQSDYSKMYDFAKNTAYKNNESLALKRILFCNLEKIEPQLAERLKTKILADFKIREKCTLFDPKGQFFVRKNDKSIFDRNCYYTHNLLIYEFVPGKVDNVKNKYTFSSGYDKAFNEKKTHRFSGKIFSTFLNKEIYYDIFMEVNSYNMNLYNNYSTKVS